MSAKRLAQVNFKMWVRVPKGALWLLIRSSNNLILNLPFLHGSHKSMSLGPTPLSWLLAIYLIFCYQSDLLKNSVQRSENYIFFTAVYSFPNNSAFFAGWCAHYHKGTWFILELILKTKTTTATNLTRFWNIWTN